MKRFTRKVMIFSLILTLILPVFPSLVFGKAGYPTGISAKGVSGDSMVYIEDKIYWSDGNTIIEKQASDVLIPISMNQVQDNDKTTDDVNEEWTIINQDGGVVNSPDNQFTIVIPENSTTEDLKIKVIQSDTDKELPYKPLSKIYKIEKLGELKGKINIQYKALAPANDDFDLRRVLVYSKDQVGNWQLLNTKVNRNVDNLEIDASNLTTIAYSYYNDSAFIDIKNHWAKDAIDVLAAHQMLNGYTENSFRPEQSISRAEFVKILVKAFDLHKIDNKELSNFTDLENHWGREFINIANQHGIIQGTNNKFHPNNKITREEIITIMVRALKLKDQPNLTNTLREYEDHHQVSDWAKPYVDYALSNELIKGKSGLIAPLDHATRAEAATVIARFIIPVIFAMDSEDNQHIEGFNYIFDVEPIDYDIGYVADIMEYLEEELGYDVYDINVQYDSTVTNDVFNTNNVDNLGHLIDLPEIRALSWKDLKVNYLMASVYGKVLLDRPIDYSINKYEFEIYMRFLWLLENKNLTYEQKSAVYNGIYYIISSEYKIVKAAMNDARNLVEFDATEKSETLLRQAENHWEAVMDQLKKGNTLPAMIILQHANLKAHEVLQIYGYEYTMENLKVDSDGDGLIDLAENMYNTDPNNVDTDGDHLNDLFEIETTQTNPTTKDSDENGITDDQEDFDNDGLTNIEEFNHGTDPYSEDTDQDRLSDSMEVNIHKTIPTICDTDGDTVGDGREIELGLNPLVIDTDGDGILDDMERFSQNITIDEEDQTHFEEIGVIPQVTIHGPALEPHNVYIRDAHELWNRLENNVGLIGHAVDIETGYNFDKASITFQYTEKALNGAKPENLRVLWYDEENDKYVLMPNTLLDLESKTVSVETTHFSIYMLVDKEKLVQAF